MKRKVKCLFDPNHEIDEDKMEKHMNKCKSENKKNYVRCQYNPTHWLKWNKIKEHEEKCQQEKSSVNDSALFDILRELQQKEDMAYIGGITTSKVQKHGRWQEPNFAKWVEQNYSKKKTFRFDQLSFENEFSEDEEIPQQKY